MKYLRVILFLLLSLAGCRKETTLEPFKWRPAGGEFDSICVRLEWMFNEYMSIDSIRFYIDSLYTLTESEPKKEALRKSRAHYWNAKYFSRIGSVDSCLEQLRQALRYNDSVDYRYDFLRIKMLLVSTDPVIEGAEEYKIYNECLDFAKENGDIATEAMVSIMLGDLLRQLDARKGLFYFNTADSLNNILGFNKFTVKNKINQALLLKNTGDTESADSILQSLIKHPVIIEDTATYNLILNNLYKLTGNPDYLYQAAAQADKSSKLRFRRGYYNALKSDYFFNYSSLPDSTVYYADLAFRDLPVTTELNDRIEILYARSQALFKTGIADSAFLYRLKFEEMVDTLQARRQYLEVLKLSALTEAGQAQSRYIATLYHRNMIIAIICMIFIIIGAGVLVFFNRRIMSQKIKAMESEMALERSRRHITATSVNMQEKDNILEILKEELSEMRRKGTIDDTNALRLESTIKAHLSEKESDEAFADMYGVIKPVFAIRLQERCGELADSYIKLAGYILIGLDNKKIARLMNIKPESVRQSRWRLRQKLSLKDDETMEEILQKMNQ